MAEISISLTVNKDAHTQHGHGGPRVTKVIDDLPIKDDKAKIRSRLKDKRRKKEQDDRAEVEHESGRVFVSKINWKGRQFRGPMG